MIKSLGLPYMGSKRKLAPKILDLILKENPNCKMIYDLFGGGGAISFEALQRPQIERVVYNELKPAVVALLNKIRKDGVTEEFYKWISRSDFKELIQGGDWKAGLAQTCYSFGNNFRNGYLYGESNENLKRRLHEVIVSRCERSRDDLQELIGYRISDDSLLLDFPVQKRRLLIMKEVRKQVGRTYIQHLESIQRLEHLGRIQQLEILNQGYDEVEIKGDIDEVIIYLDPPYKNTAKYSKDSFDYGALYDYIDKSPYKIYLSSYESHLPCVLEIDHISTLSSTNNSKRVVEKLFTNKTINADTMKMLVKEQE